MVFQIENSITSIFQMGIFEAVDPNSTLFKVVLGSFLGLLWGVIAEWQRERKKKKDEDENGDEDER